MDSRSMTLSEKETSGSTSASRHDSIVDSTKTEVDVMNLEAPTKVDNGQTPTQDEVYPDGKRMIAISIAVLLSIFLVALDMTIISTALPAIIDDFHVYDIGWWGSAFFLTVGSFQSTWGKGYKYFPLKPTFLTSIAIFELGSLICGVAPNSTALIIGRAIAGVGGAGIATGAYTIIAVAARPSQRAAYTGLLGAAYGVASVVGPLLGGVFADQVTWRMCFYINLPIGGISAAIILFTFTTPPQFIPTKATLKEKILNMDIAGTLTTMAALICFILAMQMGGQTKAWNSSTVIGLLVGAGIFIILFVPIQYFQGERALIVGRLLKNRNVSVGMAFVFFLGGGFFALLYFLPIYFQVVKGVSASQSGVRNLPLILTITIASIVSGGLISATGHFVPFLIVGSSVATVGAGLIYTLSTTSGSPHWIGYQILAGFGIGLALQVPVISAQASVGPSDLSSATAMILFAQTIGGAFFVAAGQSSFVNIVAQKLLSVPSVTPAEVIAVPVTELRNRFRADIIPGIISSYMDSLKIVYAISTAALGLAVLVSLASKWSNLKGKQIVAAAA